MLYGTVSDNSISPIKPFFARYCREFDKCFPSEKSSASPLLMWIDLEVEWFSDKVL
jgi:hypothetical protein